MKPGFFLSNEPGYYKEDDFGVRLENILEVIPADKLSHNGQRFLKFRDVTLVPYEPKLIKINMLTSPHRRWLNNYNKRIREEVGAELKKNLKMKAFYWMMAKTMTIPETDSYYFFSDNSQAMPSTNKQFHTLVIIVATYHIIKNFTSD